jgi:DNA-binding LytR/AlgR family response regulator
VTQHSLLYLLERFEMGVVQLDVDRRVVAMNDLARRVLPVDDRQPFDRAVLSFHPERSQSKVAFLLDQAGTCPLSNPPPMTMIINIPERVLLIRVSRLSDAQRRLAGYTMVFYDITEVVSVAPHQDEPDQRRRLKKIPTVANQQLVLVDAEDVLHLHSDGHYTRVITADGNRFCNLSLGDLEARLDAEQFMRVHRSHIVNLSAVQSVAREGGRLVIHLARGAGSVPVSRTSSNDVLARLGVGGEGLPRTLKAREPAA